MTSILSAIVLGFSAGVSPGPLLTLTISQTIRHHWKEGMKVAFAPLVTDAPIILVSYIFVNQLARDGVILGILSTGGGLFLAYLSYESFTCRPPELDTELLNPRSLQKGILVNFLNPNPYLFWISVGTPMLVQSSRDGWIYPALFLFFFFLLLIGSKIGIAWLVHRSRAWLQSTAYRWINRLLGVALGAFAVRFFFDGLELIAGRQ